MRLLNHNYLITYLIGFCVVLCLGCNNSNQEITQDDVRKYRDPLIEANKAIVKKDAEKIQKYAKRRGWDMAVTGTGLYYMFLVQNDSTKAKVGDLATVNYKINLLDGSYCYSSDSLGAKSFKVGQGGVESGLEEGILLMGEGDKARFIMQPYMAHGVPGDGEKIPPLAIIVYEVELLSITE